MSLELFVQPRTEAVYGAVLSPDRLYRYSLSRWWGPDDGQRMLWVMLNPSTADSEVDDPTIRRCMGFAKREGCVGIEVLNLYALRATKPRHLLDHPDPEGPDNADIWRATLDGHDGPVVAGWGANCHLGGLPASRAFWDVRPTGYLCVGITAGGDPRHPLYVRADAPLTPFTGAPS